MGLLRRIAKYIINILSRLTGTDADFERRTIKYQHKSRIPFEGVYVDTEIIRQLFNANKLKLADADWYAKWGYDVVCADGKVESVQPK